MKQGSGRRSNGKAQGLSGCCVPVSYGTRVLSSEVKREVSSGIGCNDFKVVPTDGDFHASQLVRWWHLSDEGIQSGYISNATYEKVVY